MSKWISVKKQLPTESGKYLCHCIFLNRGGMVVRRVLDINFSVYNKEWEVKDMFVTRWQDLPELPEVF